MKALFAGSFDPFTIGHYAIVRRALKLFDTVVIAIGHNEHKPGEWTEQERLNAISSVFEGESEVYVACYSGLTSTFAKELGADVLLRGIRSIQDFEYERNLADINREVLGIDTVLLISDPAYSYVSSSMVRELIHNGYDAEKYIVGNFPINSRFNRNCLSTNKEK